MKMYSKSTLYIIFLLVILIWGISWPITKLGLYNMPPLWFAFSRILLGFIVFTTFALITRSIGIPSRQDIVHLLSVGLLLIAMFQILSCVGLSHISAGRSTILVYTTQIWTIPIAYLIYKEPITRNHLISLLLGLAGIIILFSPLGIDWHDSNQIIGNSLMLLAAFVWSINMVITRYQKWHSTPLQLLSWQLLIGLVPLLLAGLYFTPSPIIHWNHTLIIALLITGVLGTAFGIWGMVLVNKELPIATTSLSLVAIPLVGIISSSIILGEKITFVMVIGLACIIGGILLIIKENWQAKKPSSVTKVSANDSYRK